MFDLPEAIRAFSNDLRKREPHQQIVMAICNPHDMHNFMKNDSWLGANVIHIGEPDRVVGVSVRATDLVAPGQVQFVIFRNPGWTVLDIGGAEMAANPVGLQVQGYITDSEVDKNGVTIINKLELLGISVVVAPPNPDCRFNEEDVGGPPDGE